MKMDAQEKKWQRENDAHTLASAEEIRADKNRLSGAKKEAKVMVKETNKRAVAMKKVAGTKSSSVAKKAPAKKAPAKKAAPTKNTRAKKK